MLRTSKALTPRPLHDARTRTQRTKMMAHFKECFGARESRGVCGGHPDGGRLVPRPLKHGRGGHGRRREDFDEFGEVEEVSRFRCGGVERGSRGRQSARNGGRPRALGVYTNYRA